MTRTEKIIVADTGIALCKLAMVAVIALTAISIGERFIAWKIHQQEKEAAK